MCTNCFISHLDTRRCIFGPLGRLKSAPSEAAQAQKIDRTGPMHPRRWAWSAGVAKLAHGRASLGRQLRQNTRIFGPYGRLVKKKRAPSEAARAQKIDRTGPMHPIGWAQSTGVAKIAHGRASLGRQLRQPIRVYSARPLSVGDPARVRATIYFLSYLFFWALGLAAFEGWRRSPSGPRNADMPASSGVRCRDVM